MNIENLEQLLIEMYNFGVIDNHSMLKYLIMRCNGNDIKSFNNFLKYNQEKILSELEVIDYLETKNTSSTSIIDQIENDILKDDIQHNIIKKKRKYKKIK